MRAIDPNPHPSQPAIGGNGEDWQPYCQTCGYELIGVPGTRCPECGTAFDAELQFRERADRIERRAFWARNLFRWPIFALLFFFGLFCLIGYDSTRWVVPQNWSWGTKDSPGLTLGFATLLGGVLATVQVSAAMAIYLAFEMSYTNALLARRPTRLSERWWTIVWYASRNLLLQAVILIALGYYLAMLGLQVGTALGPAPPY